ncbi:MAG TPA: SGNH/GDSL hydrolase family protein [Thermoanaerobaculia bacterium]|jgi:acyl-CoA thioesterase-1|nr:SGNH/GDSL hydrolase family protein [Thermoanaerobaculia bacterium]
MTSIPFTHYIALGDSISIDSYPAADVARRYAGKASTTELGAVSLLVRNDDKLWPEFRGRDLRIPVDDLTSDGATTHSLLRQVERVTRSDEATLITITAGGNDLLGEIGGSESPAHEIFARLETAVRKLLALRPNATILIGTVYDPSDGTNRLPGYGRTLDREAQWLAEYNGLVRTFAHSDPRLRLADIHRHFLGHGMTVSERERWYLAESIIEPSARGASEVRRVWLEVLGL